MPFEFWLFLFYAIPLLSLALFVLSLVRYLLARRANKITPGRFSPQEIKKREITLLIFMFIVGVFLAIIVGCVALLALAVAYM